MSMREKRLLELAEAIEKKENRSKIRMEDWFDYSDTGLDSYQVAEKIIETRRPICGTTACAAGWAVFMYGTKDQIIGCVHEKLSWSSIAQELLDINSIEGSEIFIESSGRPAEVAATIRDIAKNPRTFDLLDPEQ